MIGNNIVILKWPENPPDLNPIENSWVIVKKGLKKHEKTIKNELILVINQIWNHDFKIKNMRQNLAFLKP